MDHAALRKIREKRLKEVRMWEIIKEISLYIFYLWVILVLSYGNRSPNAFYLQKSFTNAFLRMGDLDVDFTKVCISSRASFKICVRTCSNALFKVFLANITELTFTSFSFFLAQSLLLFKKNWNRLNLCHMCVCQSINVFVHVVPQGKYGAMKDDIMRHFARSLLTRYNLKYLRAPLRPRATIRFS